jgi:glycosyltransferase involved in cell wall biosynthesis
VRIGMLLMGGTYPPDIRVAKEAKVLLGAGHEVFLLASDRDGRPAEETVEGVQVRRYRAKAGFAASKSAAAVTFATWRSPLWVRAIGDYVDANGIEALHVHDLPGVASALAVGRKRGIPVVFDMHENYAAAVGFWPRTSAARLFQTPARYRAYERDAVRSVDRVVTVVDESRDRVVALGAQPEKVVVFTNVDDVSAAPAWKPDISAFRIAYAGGFGPHRGIDTLIRALPLVRSRVPDARLVLMGAGEGESELRELAVAQQVSTAIDFTGWVGLDEMRRRLAEASVGVVPHERSEHTETTVPHKLFQYMAMGLPLVVTDCAPLARIVRETGAGRIAVAGDPRSLADAIVELATPSAADEASAAGVRAVQTRYNLEVEGAHLTHMYAGLAGPA